MKINNLIKKYPNGYTALKGVTFSTSSVGMISIVGDSGSGKTTLLNCIFGAEDFSGSIVIDNIELTPKNRDSLRRQKMSMIYQDFQLFEDMSIDDNLRIAADCVGIKLNDSDIDEALAKVGLGNKDKKNKITTLSGGEKQRVGIARSLVQKSKLLLADEPTGNLDSRNSTEIFELLKALSDEMLILVVSHKVEMSRQYSTHYLELRDGEILSTDLPTDVSNDTRSTDVIEDRKTNLSGRTFLRMVAQTGKNKILLTLLSIFTVVFLAMSFISGSFLLSNEYKITRANTQQRPPHTLRMRNFSAYKAEDFGDINGVYKAFSFYFRDSENEPDIDIWDNLDANYFKDDIGDHADTVVECNDVANIGAKLICGRNVNDYDEIVINEMYAYMFVSHGEYKEKKIERYEDLLGCYVSNLEIVGIVDARFDKYTGEYKDYTKRQFVECDEETQYKMKLIKDMLNNTVDVKYHVVKEGYSEHTRMNESINPSVNQHGITYFIESSGPSYDYKVYNGEEYYAFDGNVSTVPPQNNEVVLDNEFWWNMLIKKPTEPITLEFSVGGEWVDLKIIGYSKGKESYVNQAFADYFYNDNKYIFDYAYIASNLKLMDEVYARLDKLKKNPAVTVSVESGYTYGMHDVASFLDDYRTLFIIMFAVSVALLALFSVLSAYIVLKQKRRDILIMRKLSMNKMTLGKVYIFALTALGLIQILAASLLYAGALAGINALVKSGSAVAFNTLFFEGLCMPIISVIMLVIGALFILRYLSVLFSKSVGFRQKQE